jgi:hypothetical protein
MARARFTMISRGSQFEGMPIPFLSRPVIFVDSSGSGACFLRAAWLFLGSRARSGRAESTLSGVGGAIDFGGSVLGAAKAGGLDGSASFGTLARAGGGAGTDTETAGTGEGVSRR